MSQIYNINSFITALFKSFINNFFFIYQQCNHQKRNLYAATTYVACVFMNHLIADSVME